MHAPPMRSPVGAPLPIVELNQAAWQAHDQLRERASGKIFALHSRLPAVDKVLLGGHQFDTFYVYAGASGAGKSYFLTLLEQDFCNPEKNPGFYDEQTGEHAFAILHFCFEMSASDEVLRMVSSRTGMSYGTLMSAEKPLDAAGEAQALAAFKELLPLPIHYVETAGNWMQIEATVEQFQQKFPNKKLIVTLDHTLLPEYLNEKDEVELTSKIARLGIRLRKKYQAMVIFLSQLNDKIEHPLRIQTNTLHYPTKTDLHSSKSIYQNADVVGVLHRPETLKIDRYGREQWDTRGLLALHILKNRKGAPGVVKLKAHFERGTIAPW